MPEGDRGSDGSPEGRSGDESLPGSLHIRTSRQEVPRARSGRPPGSVGPGASDREVRGAPRPAAESWRRTVKLSVVDNETRVARLRQEMAEQSAVFESAPAGSIVAWAVARFGTC